MNKDCNLCNLEFKSDDQLKQHLEGKKHKKLETIREERQKSAQRSLFVSNLKSDTFVKQIEEHFAQFGQIKKIVIDPVQNAYAIVEFDQEESVERALNNISGHRVNGRNLKCKRREVKEFVSTIPKGTDRKKKALDQLKQENLEINTLLAKCETFDDQINELVSHLESKPEENKAKDEICHELKKCFKNFWQENDYDVRIFGSTASNLACTRSDMDLTLLLKDYFPDNEHRQQKLPPYIQKQLKEDSIMRNADDDNSNSNSNNQNDELDESIDLDEEDDDQQQGNGNNEDKENKEHNEQLKKAIQSFFVEKNYKLFNQFDVEQQMKIVAKIIERFYPNVKSLKTLISARCPVVRFFDAKAQVFCDFSLNNYLAVENTNLVKLYLELVPSLKKVVFLIRYWAKQKNLSGSNRFNTYTLIWLVLFYLQSKKILNLPTVARLSDLKGEIKYIHGWNCAFETNIQKINALKTDAVHSCNQNFELNDLLKGFFDFYSNIDFSSYILCTRSAHTLRRDEKTDLVKLSPYINIQDAFELNHNLTVNISKNTMERFKAECKGSWELLNNSSLMKKSANKCWGLILLTTKKALPLSPSNNKAERASKEQVENSFLKLKLFDDEKATSAKKCEKNPKDFVLFLLKDCLLFEPLLGDKMIAKRRKRLRVLNQICHQVDSLGLNSSPKRLKINDEHQQDGLANKPTFICVFDENNNGNNKATGNEDDIKIENLYQFNTNLNTWQGRRSAKRELKNHFPNLNEIELEKMTSQRIQELNMTKPEPHKKSMNFSIQFLNYSQKPHEQTSKVEEEKQNGYFQIKLDILDEIQTEQELLEFKSLFHFMQTYMNNSYEKLFDLWSNSQVNLNSNQTLAN